MAVQAPLWQRLAEEGLEPLLRELAALSPADAHRAQRNPRRVIRALEIWQRTGRSPADFPLRPPRFGYAKLALLPEPAALAPRIAARTREMIARGLLDEVAYLQARYPKLATAKQAIGYREIIEHLAGRLSLEAAIAQIERATLQYAKRQRTWLRKEPSCQRLAGLATELVPELRAWLSRAAA